MEKSITSQKISTNLWFDGKAEEAVNFYLSIFKNAKTGRKSYYGASGQEIHGMKPGTIMTMEFELEGQHFVALNGGPHFKFTEAISFIVNCKDQEEIDYYWDKLSSGGDPKAQVCGWLKDKYGLSWQIVPAILTELLQDPDTKKTNQMMAALMQMKKLDISQLKTAFEKQ